MSFPGAAAHAQTAADPGGCADCHSAEAAQIDTPMAQALEVPGGNPVLAGHPSLSWHKGPYTWTVATKNGRSTYSVSDGTKTISLPIRWAFGSSAQTWVFDVKGTFYQSAVSFYPEEDGLRVTIGDQNRVLLSLQQAIGRKLSPVEVQDCFRCHTTGGVSADQQLTLSSLHPGVSCAHCHQGALQHAEDADLGDNNSAPPKLRDLSAEEMASFCGQCHRTWDTVVRHRWHGLIDVRFQPYRLQNSRCFNGTDPRISCVACHNPHRNLIRNDLYYDRKCLACHGPGARPTSTGKAKACPVSSSHCVSCHMPKIALPGSHRVFTDHEIRIVRVGESFPD